MFVRTHWPSSADENRRPESQDSSLQPQNNNRPTLVRSQSTQTTTQPPQTTATRSTQTTTQPPQTTATRSTQTTTQPPQTTTTQPTQIRAYQPHVIHQQLPSIDEMLHSSFGEHSGIDGGPAYLVRRPAQRIVLTESQRTPMSVVEQARAF
ncbi:hypothetical protein GGTG_04933 [Gaeumannomyces tritici R3-111a-1]|uniref:Uncharacterized protein n=1 Tax=Gaeumannomyces tritici (strain R3-111a-1) TaxID=644352 RepID=J3NUH7_GAET3|nr:hypothetical protein GGTG_04933 [Gaeumannomyces tritici R3-111a-1]EJT79850.1 hypothetical protein GGTG_04933 [Gaeumannomyces tritici R3-111a-1]